MKLFVKLRIYKTIFSERSFSQEQTKQWVVALGKDETKKLKIIDHSSCQSMKMKQRKSVLPLYTRLVSRNLVSQISHELFFYS